MSQPTHVCEPIQPSAVRDEVDFIRSYKDQNNKFQYECDHPTCKGRRDCKTKQHHTVAVFSNLRNARDHVRRDMNIIKAFKCRCGTTFSSEDSAKRHCNTKSAGKVHKCTQCGRGFERKDYLKVHVKKGKCRQAH